MKIKHIFIASFCLLLLSSCIKEDPQVAPDTYSCTVTTANNHPEASNFQQFLDERIAMGIPGMAMLIQTPTGIWQGASGKSDLANDIPMLPCNTMRIGSITKIFTATLILQLHEEQKLDIEAPIANYLAPSMVDQLENASEATVRQLLSHTSGIPAYTESLEFGLYAFDHPTKVWTAEEVIAYAYDLEADFEPGTFTKYSNSNFLLLGLIAERVTGKTGPQLYEDRIFQPLGLTGTFFRQDGEKPTQLIPGYWDDQGDFTIRNARDISFAHTTMDGGMASTVQDLFTFQTALHTPGVLLSQATIDMMTELHDIPKLNPSSADNLARFDRFGLGWIVIETPYGIGYGHGGRITGYSSFMAYFPDQEISFAYIMNGSDGAIKVIEKELYKNDLIELLLD